MKRHGLQTTLKPSGTGLQLERPQAGPDQNLGEPEVTSPDRSFEIDLKRQSQGELFLRFSRLAGKMFEAIDRLEEETTNQDRLNPAIRQNVEVVAYWKERVQTLMELIDAKEPDSQSRILTNAQKEELRARRIEPKLRL